MSLAILVRVAVPALFALGISAAYLIFRKRQPEEGHHGGGDRSSRPQFTSPGKFFVINISQGLEKQNRLWRSLRVVDRTCEKFNQVAYCAFNILFVYEMVLKYLALSPKRLII